METNPHQTERCANVNIGVSPGLGCCRPPSNKLNFLPVNRKYEGNPTSLSLKIQANSSRVVFIQDAGRKERGRLTARARRKQLVLQLW